MKYIVLLMALINIPFFPNTINVFSCGFSAGVFVVMLINDSGLTKRVPDVCHVCEEEGVKVGNVCPTCGTRR